MSDIEPDPHATFLEYIGIAGATKESREAIERLLMSGAELRSALILTCQDGANPDHAFIACTRNRTFEPSPTGRPLGTQTSPF
jgi:hypothetical protein